MRIGPLGCVCAAAAGVASVVARAEEPPPIIVKPASAWNINYANDSCRLARVFAHGADKLAFVLDKFDAEPSFTITVAGRALVSGANKKVRVAFGPSGASRSFDDPNGATFGTFGPSVIVDSMSLIEQQSSDKTGGEAVVGVALALIPVTDASPEAARAITWFEVQRGRPAPVRFELGPMDKPMAALRTCTDELLTHWGIDVAAHKALSRRATPRNNPASWMTNDDYPSHLLSKGVQGLIYFRLMISEDGSVSECHI